MRVETSDSIARQLGGGLAIVILVFFGAGGWSVATDIAGAIVAPGTLVVDSNVKKVQHASGGIVSELNVHDGFKVKFGDVLIRLDDTITRANLAIVNKGLHEFYARKSRLEAERDGNDFVIFPASLMEKAELPDVAHIMDGERRLFEIRRAARSGQKAQLAQRILQLEDEVEGHLAQEQAKTQEIALIGRELQAARELWNKELMPLAKLMSLERESTRVAGERGQLIAQIAQVRGRISEIRLQIVQLDRDLSSEVGQELRDIDGQIGEYLERKITAEDQLMRIAIRAPQDGIIHQSSAHTVGGVINPGEAIMLVVPEDEKLQVEARIMPQDIDQVHPGQKAVLRFTAFSSRTTPEVNGEVARVSADVSADPKTGQNFYTARIALSDEEMSRLGGVKLIPGMPVEAFVQTGERKVLSYLVKPLHDQISRAFRER